MTNVIAIQLLLKRQWLNVHVVISIKLLYIHACTFSYALKIFWSTNEEKNVKISNKYLILPHLKQNRQKHNL